MINKSKFILVCPVCVAALGLALSSCSPKGPTQTSTASGAQDSGTSSTSGQQAASTGSLSLDEVLAPANVTTLQVLLLSGSNCLSTPSTATSGITVTLGNASGSTAASTTPSTSLPTGVSSACVVSNTTSPYAAGQSVSLNNIPVGTYSLLVVWQDSVGDAVEQGEATGLTIAAGQNTAANIVMGTTTSAAGTGSLTINFVTSSTASGTGAGTSTSKLGAPFTDTILANGIASRYVTVNGITMHYLAKGSSGPVLLLLHGFPEYSGIWTNYLLSLSDTYQVIAPDLRGYNLSSMPSAVSAYDVTELAKDVIGLIDALGAQQVYLAAHDWGGLLSWFIADYYPAYIQKLIVMNAPHPIIYQNLIATDADQQKKSDYVSTLISPDAEAILSANDFEALQGAVFSTSTYPFSATEKQGFLDDWGRGLTGSLNYYRNFYPNMSPYTSLMRGIKMPTLVLWGDLDPNLSIDNLTGLNKQVANLQIVHYPTATHWVEFEEAPAIMTQMRRFFQ